MPRLIDWEAGLNAYLASVMHTQFSWGSHDCALFAASAAEAITGEDRAADFRGKYDSHAGALQALRDIGSGTLLRTYRDRYPEIPVGKARRGDLIWNGFAIGVCIGPVALFVGEPNDKAGLVRVPRGQWKRAFAVGDA